MMRARAAAALLFAAFPIACFAAGGTSPPSPAPKLHPIPYDALVGWKADDHAAAFAPFRRSCGALNVKPAPAQSGLPDGASLAAACAAALTLPEEPDTKTARRFFETWFTAARTQPEGRFTGYYEPEMAGSLTKTKRFSTPLLALPDGMPNPAPDRGAIEAGAFAGRGLELVWLEPVDAFFVHIQGSARISLTSGKALRVGFAGRNGYPFTPLGRALVERGVMTKDQASMQSIRAWLAAHPKQAPALMRENKSYIFFRIDADLPEGEGPIGAQGVPVTGGRSIAVDDTIWPYGLPVWIDVPLPHRKGTAPYRRLMVAQDTGAAIRGPARADIFMGTGQQAGEIAGRISADGHFIVLVPRSNAVAVK